MSAPLLRSVSEGALLHHRPASPASADASPPPLPPLPAGALAASVGGSPPASSPELSGATPPMLPASMPPLNPPLLPGAKTPAPAGAYPLPPQKQKLNLRSKSLLDLGAAPTLTRHASLDEDRKSAKQQMFGVFSLQTSTSPTASSICSLIGWLWCALCRVTAFGASRKTRSLHSQRRVGR
jgi:hypothetical protein